MAKRPNEQPNPRPAKIRYFELEASDETVQKALATFERMQNPTPTVHRVVRNLPPANTAEEPTLFDKPDVVEGEVTDIDGDEEQPTTPEEKNGNQRRKRGEGAPVDRNAGITAPGEIDFYPQGKKSLKEFFADKAPKSDMERCLTFCFFFQEVLALPKFGAGHILAAFNHVGQRVPVDLPATLRNMREGKKGSKGWLKFDDFESIRVTTVGLNEVRHEMGNRSSDDGGAK